MSNRKPTSALIGSVLLLEVTVYEISSELILDIGVLVTITVEKIVLTVIVKLEQEELSIKGDGTGDEVIILCHQRR